MRIGEVEFVGLAFRMNSVAMVMQCCQLSLLYLVHQKAQIFFGPHGKRGSYIHTFPSEKCKPAEIKSNEVSLC